MPLSSSARGVLAEQVRNIAEVVRRNRAINNRPAPILGVRVEGRTNLTNGVHDTIVRLDGLWNESSFGQVFMLHDDIGRRSMESISEECQSAIIEMYNRFEYVPVSPDAPVDTVHDNSKDIWRHHK